jgi:tetratricopeptide (TPR) repeat protein
MKEMKELTSRHNGSNLCSDLRNGSALLDLARGWLKQGNTVVALELLQSAVSSPDTARDRNLRARILKETGRAHMMQSEWDYAEQFYLEAQQIFVEIENFKGAAECARNRANMYFQKGEFAESEALCEDSLSWASELNDHELRATILNTLAAIKSATGDLTEAVKTFKLCLADFQSSGNLIRQGYVLLNIGLAQTELEDFSDAVFSLNQALNIALEERDLNLVEICYQNIASCYLAQNETRLAKAVIQTARKILPGLNSTALTAELNLIECKLLHAMGNIEGAEKLLKKTYKLATDNNLSSLEADILFQQGKLLRDKGDFEMAATKIEAAAGQYKSLGVDKGFREAIQTLQNMKNRKLTA